MTDTLPAIAPAPADLSAESRAAAHSLYEKAGYSADALQAAGYSGPAPAATAQPPATVPAPASPTEIGHIPAQQRIAALQKLRAAGVDDITLQAAATAEGVPWASVNTETATAPAPVTLEEANQKLADTSGPLAAGSDVSDYHFTFQPADIAGLDPAQVANLNSTFAAGFHAAGVPLSVGQSLFRDLMDTGRKFAGLSEVDRLIEFRAEGARLQRMGNIQEIKADAEYAYAKMPAKFKAVIDEQHLMHGADAYLAMSRAGQLMRARTSKK